MSDSDHSGSRRGSYNLNRNGSPGNYYRDYPREERHNASRPSDSFYTPQYDGYYSYRGERVMNYGREYSESSNYNSRRYEYDDYDYNNYSRRNSSRARYDIQRFSTPQPRQIYQQQRYHQPTQHRPSIQYHPYQYSRSSNYYEESPRYNKKPYAYGSNDRITQGPSTQQNYYDTQIPPEGSTDTRNEPPEEKPDEAPKVEPEVVIERPMPASLKNEWCTSELEAVCKNETAIQDGLLSESKAAAEVRRSAFELKLAELELLRMESMVQMVEIQMSGLMETGELGIYQ